MEKAEKEEKELKTRVKGGGRKKNKENRERGIYLYELRKRDGGERMEPKV